MAQTKGRLEDKVAIIVGGGQQPGQTIGNGRATAIRFAQEGASLLVVDNREEHLEETITACEMEGAAVASLVADITREDDCRRIAQTCVDRFGTIDILHNNVGRSQGDRGTTDLDPAMFSELMELNVKGTFMTIRQVLPVMREKRSGAIVNISSTASTCASPTLTYKTSKGAVNTMSEFIALENAPYGIRCNVILPGYMDTPMAIERRARERNLDRDQIRKERADKVPLLGQQGTGWDVANAALFLASDEARYITGVCLPVEGGRMLKRG
jgi:NAD(P)-dependent dehydrogenase (short-subunit alcohol dehydrogenase family)